MFDLNTPVGKALLDAVIEGVKNMPLPDVPARVHVTLEIDPRLQRQVYATVSPNTQQFIGQGKSPPQLTVNSNPMRALLGSK